MSAAEPLTLVDPLESHCFWGWCQHTERGFDVDKVHAAMEDHYAKSHRADLDALLPVVSLRTGLIA